MDIKRQVELRELITELQKENMQKRDFVLPAKCISMVNGKIVVTNNTNSDSLKNILKECGIGHSNDLQSSDKMELSCLEVMHTHLQDKLNIPTKYYNRMLSKDDKSLLDYNVSHWLQESKSNHLLRCFVDKEEKKGYARALLSDRFKIIDNYDIMLTVLAAIKESGLNIIIDEERDERGQTGCDLTDKSMYLRFVCPDIQIDSPELVRMYRPNGTDNQVGNGIISGFVIKNSEVGMGQFSIAPRAKVKVCSNGLFRTNEDFAKTHLGAKMEQYTTIEWSDETKQKNLELIIAQVKDAIKTYVSEGYLGNTVKYFEENNKQLEYPMDAIKAVTVSLKINEDKANDIINSFMKSGDSTAFGITQAITLFAHTKSEDADEQYELENKAMEVFENIDIYDKPLPKKTTQTQMEMN